MKETKTTTYLATEDNSQGMDTYVVTHNGEDITIVRTHSSQAQTDYHTTFFIDGNSNARVSWKHGQGEGSLYLPHGVVLDLFPMSHILQAEEGNTWSTTRFFKELVTTMGGK